VNNPAQSRRKHMSHAVDGPAATLVPRSRRPRASPTKLPDDAARQVVGGAGGVGAVGLDHEPISVRETMRSLGSV
jgi:putative transposase